MPYFPAYLDLVDKRVLLTGIGSQLGARLATLRRAGAKVRVVAPIPPAGPAEEWHSREFCPNDLDDVGLAISVSSQPEEQEAVAREARLRAIPVNILDRPDLSTFMIPAVVERGEVVIGISTGGVSPSLAKRVQAEIEKLLPQRLTELARFAASFRDGVRLKLTDPEERRSFWRRTLEGPIADLVLAGETTRAREAMLRTLNTPAPRELGVVYLVGAGPGDPDLLTLAAYRALQAADIVLHDELVSDEILALVRKDAEVVSVGRRNGDHRQSQSETNRRLVVEAKASRRVVRLKSGDPFIFGRGGEELDHCRRQGVKAVVVPGVTAALGCAAYAGVPLTHRDAASTLVLMTGHRKSEEAASEPEQETIAVYMALSNVAAVAERLKRRGLHGGVPIAIIENGTRADERATYGVLADLPELATRHKNGGAALLLVGETVRLAPAWSPLQETWSAAW